MLSRNKDYEVIIVITIYFYAPVTLLRVLDIGSNVSHQLYFIGIVVTSFEGKWVLRGAK